MKPWRPGDIKSGMYTPGPFDWPIEQIEPEKDNSAEDGNGD